MNIKRRIKRCSKIKKKKHGFTLLELMIVIMILSLTAGIVGINITKAVREQRFRSEVARVVDRLRLAQNLMLIANTDVDVIFTKGKEGVDFFLETEGPLSPSWKKELERPSSPLKAVHWVEFEETVPRSHGQQGRLQLQFLSRGSVMSRGLLRLSTAARDDEYGALTRYVCLPGYPQALTSSANGECPVDRIEDDDRSLTDWTVDEVKAHHAT